MTSAMFVMSTGRCSTQFLAHALEGKAENTVVEHEPIGPHYRPRLAYRKPQKAFETLGRFPVIQRKFIEIEDHLDAGRRYVDVGWPTYGWLDYLQTRFKDRFEFIHLVRNPFNTAASILTHGAFAGRDDPRTKTCFIHADDRNVIHSEFADRYGDFTPFEKALYHWLELNSHVHAGRDSAGYRGLFRFEDLYAGDGTKLDEIATALLGNPVTGLQSDPFDNYSGKLRSGIELRDERLLDAVVAHAVELGYDTETLEKALDPAALEAAYSEKRVEKAT